MSNHDSWIFLKDEPENHSLLSVFEDGIPVRDPLPGHNAVFENRLVPLWMIDHYRLQPKQLEFIVQEMAAHCDVEPSKIILEAMQTGGLAISHSRVSSIYLGDEGKTRFKEFMDFISQGDSKNIYELQAWFEKHREKWVLGFNRPEVRETDWFYVTDEQRQEAKIRTDNLIDFYLALAQIEQENIFEFVSELVNGVIIAYSAIQTAQFRMNQEIYAD